MGNSHMLSVTPVTTTARIAPTEPAINRQVSTPDGIAIGESSAEAKSVANRPIAVDPTKQTSASQKLRDGERREDQVGHDSPAGPPPTFDETILQRQAREALDPQEQRRAFEKARLVETPAPEIDLRG